MSEQLDNLKLEISKYIKDKEQLLLIDEAIKIAEKEYKNIKLLEKIDLFSYVIDVAFLLSLYQSEPASIITALLYKTSESLDNTTLETFGEEVLNMIKALRKIDNVKKLTNYEIDNENFRKIFVALANDYKVIIIRLAMQEELLKNLDLFNKEYQKYVARETLDVYSPLAHRLGMFKLKSNLENMSLYYLDREKYDFIKESLKQKEEERMQAIAAMEKQIKEMLDENKIQYYSIKGRPKQIYSIYNKMKQKNLEFDQVFDLLALRVITKTEVNCYEILGYVHTVFKPITGKFKDYIAVPKPNMYQSLHTSVVGTDGNIYEIQIRTKEMDEIAESGVAAHWKYKEGVKASSSQKLIEEQLHWFKDYVSLSEMSASSDEYVENLKKDIFETNIYVMSPKGRVIDLPNGSTPVDFAYRIHSNVGHSCVGALVNGNMVSLSYRLKTGDVVEIKTSKLHTFPSEDWLKFVKTSYAKNCIKKALLKKNKEEFKEEFIARGNELINEEIKAKNLNEKEAYVILNSAEFLKIFTCTKLEELYMNVANRNISPITVIDKIRNKMTSNIKPTFEIKKKSLKSFSRNGIIVDGVDNIRVTLSKCCSPIPGDEIVGFISRGKGIRVHRKDCSTIIAETDRLIDVAWDKDALKDISHQVDILVHASDRSNLLVEIVNALSTLKVTIMELNASVNKQNLISTFNISILVKDNEQLKAVIIAIENVSGVLDVERLMRN